MELSKGGISAAAAFILSMFALLLGVLVGVPVEQAAADPADYGPDGYFSNLAAGATPVSTGSWSSMRKIAFGKQGNTETFDSRTISGRYRTLAKGAVASAKQPDFGENNQALRSATTSVAANEVLLWEENVVTTSFSYDGQSDTNTNTFDSETGAYQSNLAKVADDRDPTKDDVAGMNYSLFEQSLLRADTVEGVCTKMAGCKGGTVEEQRNSDYSYKVFALTIGDTRKYFGHKTGSVADANLSCTSNKCNNSTAGFWLRSAYWYSAWGVNNITADGTPGWTVSYNSTGLRPAIRLKLENLLLSARRNNQSQETAGDLRLTFVNPENQLLSYQAKVVDSDSDKKLELSGISDLPKHSSMGWKVVDPVTNSVLGSGRSSVDSDTGAAGNMTLPKDKMTDPDKDYDLYIWGQSDGNMAEGSSNMATVPVKGTVRGWQINISVLSEPTTIEVSGASPGTLSAYRIGEYEDVRFSQTGALRSVVLGTPADPVKAAVLDAAFTAGATAVDVDNPIGWVAANWLGYPADASSNDVTSAFSPHAGKLQLFAQELANNAGVLGAASGSLDGLDATGDAPEALAVSGPGLYLIVDSSGVSLPIIVGTKVFNEDAGDEGRFVDFADAGVKGKPRLGQASLKSDFTDVVKRVINDAGMDGFDAGSSVEYEIAVRVPDLSDAGYGSVSYDEYEFNLADVAEASLAPPSGSTVKILMDIPAPDTEVTAIPGISVEVAGQMLTVDGLKALFAESDGVSGVRRRSDVPAGSVIRIRYIATLNVTNADWSSPGGGAIDPNSNTVTLTRSKSDGNSEQRTSMANVYSFRVDLKKVDRDKPEVELVGARFEVSRDAVGGSSSEVLRFVDLTNGVYRLAVAGEPGSVTQLVSSADGSFSLLGVEARDLSFRETAAPSGYFKASDFTVSISPVWDADAAQIVSVSYGVSDSDMAFVSDDGKRVVVMNPAWSLANLPYTGGMGILILLVVGGLILVFAFRPYILSKRAERDANLI